MALVVFGVLMYICFIDEAGCTGTLPNNNSEIQPALIISGLIIDQKNIAELTREFLSLKKEYFPEKFRTMQHLDCIKEEIKGSELRKLIKRNRNKRRFALRFIDKIISLLERNNALVIGRVWIKPINIEFNGRSVYTSSIQKMAVSFQHYLSKGSCDGNEGIIIADSRNKSLNANVSHSIFTQKYKATGDAYDRIIEMPVYGHSDNHAGLQLADFIASALIFPIATTVYCSAQIKNTTHYDPNYLILRDQFGNRLAKLQYRYSITNGDGKTVTKGGLIVSDPLGSQGGSKLFKQ